MRAEMAHTFFHWLRMMGITNPVEAADLLQTDLETIKGYVSGRIMVPPDHLKQCQLLLRMRGSQLEDGPIAIETETDF